MQGPAPRRIERRSRRVASDAVRQLEQLLYMVVAAALGITGLLLLVHSVVAFGLDLADGRPFLASSLTLLDGLLLVFIVAELLHTVRAAVNENVLLTEPFLIVGLIATIRRLIMITAEVSGAVGTPRFDELMVELAALAGVTLVLGVTLFMIRHTDHAEPRPSHEETMSPDGSPAEGSSADGSPTEDTVNREDGQRSPAPA